MLGRSLETLGLRMELANSNARIVAEWLAAHPNVAKLHYLGLLAVGSPEKAVYDRQCTGAGSTFSFDIKVPLEVHARIGVLDTTIRLSVGTEHPDDLIADLTQALPVTGTTKD